MKKKHYRVGGTALCACGFSAYSVSGIMLDYGEVLRWHIEDARRRTMNDTESRNPLIDELADIEHQRWADWQKYLHGLCIVNADGSLTIPASNVDHWRRQIHTSYAELTEREKQSDRDQVERYMPIIDRIKQEAYARGQRDAYNDAAKDMKDMERDFRNEIAAAYREGEESGREW